MVLMVGGGKIFFVVFLILVVMNFRRILILVKLIVLDLDVKDKKVLICVDFNVLIKDGKIGDDNWIVVVLLMIKYVIEYDGKVILFLYLGWIKSEDDKKGLSLCFVVECFLNLLNKFVIFVFVIEGE